MFFLGTCLMEPLPFWCRCSSSSSPLSCSHVEATVLTKKVRCWFKLHSSQLKEESCDDKSRYDTDLFHPLSSFWSLRENDQGSSSSAELGGGSWANALEHHPAAGRRLCTGCRQWGKHTLWLFCFGNHVPLGLEVLADTKESNISWIPLN